MNLIEASVVVIVALAAMACYGAISLAAIVVAWSAFRSLMGTKDETR